MLPYPLPIDSPNRAIVEPPRGYWGNDMEIILRIVSLYDLHYIGVGERVGKIVGG
jgi:hypothetical protein